MNTMALAHLEDTTRRMRAKRITPVRTPSDAAAQIFELYDRARKHHGDHITAEVAYYLSQILRNLADLRLTQSIADSVIDGIERRLAELEGKFDVLELLS